MLARLKVHCHPRLRLHLFRRKEVILVLMYNFFVATALFSIYSPSKIVSNGKLRFILIAIAAIIAFPVLGCLADNFFSRYKIVSSSLKLIWVTAMIYCAASIVFYVKGIDREQVNLFSTCGGVDLAFKAILSFGLGGFIVNIGQLSMDQLHDASSNDVIAFIVWHLWTWWLAGLVVMLSRYANFKLANQLLLCVSASCVLCLDFLFNHWLVKEPPSKSPFKLFLGVLRYALKNKQPRLRSAFTYWDNKKYSRIDLAKSKYGGPYTTEEVEDVKTFLRMLVIIAFVGFVTGLCSVVSDYGQNLLYHFQDSGNQSNYFHLFLINGFAYLSITIFVPIHELFLYPLLWKFVLRMNSAFKFNLFLVFVILSFLISFIVEVVGYMKLTEDLRTNLTCVLTEGLPFVALPLTFKWIYIAKIFSSLGTFYLASSFAEFICANSPYSLKGLIFGYSYMLYSLSVVFCGITLFPIIHLKAKTWTSVVLGCGAWFSLSVIVVFVTFLVLGNTVVKKLYKTRRRDEDIHNRHIFAINYYSHYVKYNEELESSYK